MISHSVITVIWMLVTSWLIGPVGAALFITGVWWSREQYWDELNLRWDGRDSWRDVLLSMAMVFRPMRRNMDLFAPVVVAWAMVGVFMLAQ